MTCNNLACHVALGWHTEGEGAARVIVINLIKKQRTQKNQHWKTVLCGDAEIDTSKFGPLVQAVDANDPTSMKQMIAAMRDSKSDQ